MKLFNPVNGFINLIKLMSSHKGGLLETQQAFNFTRTGSLDSRRNSINPQAFTAVRENIMYRTTYGSFHSKVTYPDI